MIGVAFYDLAVSPPTWDFLSFLLTAERWRLRHGLDGIEVRVISGPAGGFRNDTLPPHTTIERERMRDGIVLPLARMLPSCVASGMIGRADAVAERRPAIGLATPMYGLHLAVQAAREGCFPLLPPPWPLRDGPAPFVTITLRECSYWPGRNSDLAQWLMVAEAIEARGFEVIVIRDTALADEPVPGFRTDPQASRDLVRRATLYAAAAQNLFVNNGPAALPLSMGAPFLTCKILSPDGPCTNASHMAGGGLPPGSQWPNSRPDQRLLWEDDRADAIIGAFDALMAGAR